MFGRIIALFLYPACIRVGKIASTVLLVGLAVTSKLPPATIEQYTHLTQQKVIFILAISGAVLLLYAEFAEIFSKRRSTGTVLHSICEVVHTSLEGRRPPGSTLRVTIFEPRRLPRNCWARLLVSTARFFRGEGPEQSRIDFRLDEGTVGAAFSGATKSHKHGLPSYDANPEIYLETVSRECHIKREKLEKSNTHGRCFLSVPVIYADCRGKAAAVVSLDSSAPDAFPPGEERKVTMMVETMRSLYHKHLS